MCEAGYKLVGSTNLVSKKSISTRVVSSAQQSNTRVKIEKRTPDTFMTLYYSLVLQLCQSDGTWSGFAPSCMPLQQTTSRCPPIKPVSGGSTAGDCSVPIVGSTCTLTCPSGFQIIGARIARCFSDGTWAPATPACRRK